MTFDNPGFAAFVGVIVGGIITGITTLGVEWLRSNGEWTTDQKKREDNRRLGLEELQRVTLLELQGAVIDMARSAAQINLHDLRHFHETGRWERTQVGEELAEFDRVARQRANALKTRVADDEARELIEQIGQEHHAMLVATNATDADQANLRATRLTAAFMEKSGALIRATFRVDST